MTTWTIEQLERETQTGLVTTVHWRATATENIDTDETVPNYINVISATSYGSLGLTAGDSTIPFADLTKDVVIGWVKDKLGAEAVTTTEASLAQQLADQKAPKSTAGFPEAWNQV
jgi:hypothetical protein